MSYESATVLVQCTAPSHDEAIPCRRFRVGRRDGGPWTWTATTQQTLIDDKPLDEQEIVSLHGTPTRSPDLTMQGKARRLRWSAECPRCGVRADMRRETAVRVVEGYANAGVFVVDLEALAANL